MPVTRDVEHEKFQESRTVGSYSIVDCSQDCFKSTGKVFFKIKVAQQLPEDTTHPKLGVGTKLKNQLSSVWLSGGLTWDDN